MTQASAGGLECTIGVLWQINQQSTHALSEDVKRGASFFSTGEAHVTLSVDRREGATSNSELVDVWEA